MILKPIGATAAAAETNLQYATDKMVVCRFFQQGNCKFGASCRNEHPQSGGNQSGYDNRFAALNSGQSNQGRASDVPPIAALTDEIVQRDLTSELPQWILSCYGPGRDAPEQLFGGLPREQSFEEMRLHYMMGAINGNPQAALNDIQTIYQNAQQQIQHTLNDIPGAIRFIVNAANKHPNRVDICNNASGGAVGLASNAFGAPPPQVSNPFGAPAAAPATPAAGAFGQSSALGQKPNPFGAPAFGQPAQPANSAFGQAPALGASNSVFGKPAQPGGAFGQPSALVGGGLGGKVFGQGAAQPAFGQSGFAQAAATQPGVGFGQTATLGAKPNPFGAQQQPAANPFGQAQQPAQNTGVFGQPATNAATANNPFGAPSPANNAFGAPAAAATPSPFGGQPTPAAPSPFGQPQQPTQQANNPFGGAPAALAAAPAANPFGQPVSALFGGGAAAKAVAQATPVFEAAARSAAGAPQGQGQGQGPYGPNATRQHPDISAYSSKNPDGTLRMFKGKPVTYDIPKGADKPLPFIRQFDGSMLRIWMPNGAPPYTKETEADDPSKYDDPAVQQQWASFIRTGQFEDGLMPEVPPKREWCQWDF
ncbi:nucleoporin AMO1 [Cladorrhinum sp. PSN259]|nr:nucleoporin AMO1 [Cladorrhinum sp. PSN259]